MVVTVNSPVNPVAGAIAAEPEVSSISTPAVVFEKYIIGYTDLVVVPSPTETEEPGV